MTDVLKQLNDTLEEITLGYRNVMGGDELKLLLFNAAFEIERLRKRNIDIGWQINPDRMGGQFTSEERNPDGSW
jgi:hypothetical protein